MAEPQARKGMGIRNWLSLLLLSILLPLVALQGYRYYALYQEKQETALQANLEMARSVAKAFDSFVQDVLRQELAIGLAVTSSTKMAPGDILRLLETSVNYPAIRDFTWLNPKGMAVYSANPALAGADFSDRSHVRDVVGGREWAVGDLAIGKRFGKPAFGISRGIRDGRGNLLGVVFAAIVPDKLDAQLAVERSEGGSIFLVDRRGTRVYRYPAIEPAWEERNWLRQYPEFEEAFKGREISAAVFAPHEGKDRLVSLAPVSSIGWAAGAGKRKEDVTGPIVRSLVRDAVLFLSVSLAAFLIATALSRKIANPIEGIRDYAASLADREAPEPIEAGNVSELKDLANSFDAMDEKVRKREEALRESEERYRALVESAPDAVFVHRDGEFLYANPVALDLCGAETLEQLRSRRVPDLIHSDDGPAIAERMRQALAGQSLKLRETKLVRLDGRVVPVESSGGTIVYRGSPAFQIIVRDITERNRMEDELRRAKDELEARVTERTYELYMESLYSRNLIEASVDPLATISVDGKITDVNRSTEEATGLSREELIGSDFSDYFTEPEKARSHYREVLQRGLVRDYPLELKHRDGHATPVLYNATPYRDEMGNVMGVFAAARDVTAQKRAEESACAERQRLYDVLDTLPVYTILLTPDYRVVFANRFFRERFGEDRGRRCHEYLFNLAEPCEVCETYTVRTTGKPHRWEWKGPDERNYDIFDFPFVDSDGAPLIMEVGIDITERKEAEASLRKLASDLVMAEERERKRIAAVLHDEIAQTLAAAKMRMGAVQGLPSDQEKSMLEVRALLAQSIQETRALMTEIGNPLLFDMGLKAACRSLADRLMESHPVRISCDIRDEGNHTDPDVKTMAFQVIRELLNNVVKHSRARQAHVHLEMEDGCCRISVTDDGTGFDPQALGAPTADGGFGLYSMRERLLAMKGGLRVVSAPGQGTVVIAVLPTVRDSSHNAGGKPA